jgi:hypothetical protein
MTIDDNFSADVTPNDSIFRNPSETHRLKYKWKSPRGMYPKPNERVLRCSSDEPDAKKICGTLIPYRTI